MAVDAAAPPTVASAKLAAALKDALGTALLALGLAVPILALRTEQNISNELVLQPRWHYVAILVALAFAARFLYLVVPRRSLGRSTFAAPPGLARILSLSLLTFL